MKPEEMKMLKDYKSMIEKELFTELGKNAEACACEYHKHKMVSSIIRTINEIDDMLQGGAEYAAWSGESHEITPEMEKKWAAGMMNSDGTHGAHWTIDQTTAVAKQNGVMFDHISAEDWMIALNMIYSDYGQTLQNAGISDVSVFAELAKDFLFDKDALPPKEKLCYYYKYIVKK